MAGPPPFPGLQTVRSFREGVGVSKKSLDAWIVAGGLSWIATHARVDTKYSKSEKEQGIVQMSDVKEAYEQAARDIAGAKEAYDKSVAAFRSQVKNDLASIAAAAERVKVESQKMNASYRATIDALNSDDMKRAIDNAERIAAALTSISGVRGSSLTFAVLGSKPEAGAPDLGGI